MATIVTVEPKRNPKRACSCHGPQERLTERELFAGHGLPIVIVDRAELASDRERRR